jgi:hypothetical protein
MVYSITLSKDQVSGLRFHEGRGYTAGLLSLAVTRETAGEGLFGGYWQKGVVVGFETEAAAWEWRDNIEADPEAFGTCMTLATLRKVRELEAQIV